MKYSMALLLVVLIATSGCVNTYVQPPEGSAVAYLQFPKSGGIFAPILDYARIDPAACGTPEYSRGMYFSGFFRKNVVRIPANEKIYVLATSSTQGQYAGTIRVQSCQRAFSLIPEAGKKYIVNQVKDVKTCALSVVGEGESAPPESLMYYKPSSLCARPR